MSKLPDPWPSLPTELRSMRARLDARPDKRESEATA